MRSLDPTMRRTNPRQSSIVWTALVGSALATTGCEPEETWEGELDFERLQQGLFEPACGGAGCHSPNSAKGGLVLEGDGAWDSLMYAPCEDELAALEGLVRVAPGDPDGSFLFIKLGDPGAMGDPMPPWEALAPEDIAAVERWIREGAKR